MNYRDYIESDAWKQRRALAIERAGHRCQLCAKSPKTLTVHHNSYANLGAEKDEDLCVLCWPCHQRHHDKTKKVTAKDIRSGLSRKARQLVRRLNLEPQSVTLTASERKRRQNHALSFIAKANRKKK